MLGDAEYKAFEVLPLSSQIDIPAYEEQASLIVNIATKHAVVCLSGFRMKRERYGLGRIGHPAP